MKKSVFEQVLEDFLADIFSNHFRPGEILSERMLTEAYGCSKTTMREVLVMLCQSRILRSIPRLGYEVIWMEEGKAREVLEVRRYIELGFFRENMRKITPEIMEKLRTIVKMAEQAEREKDIRGHWDCNAEFHMELIRLSGSGYAEWSLQFALGTLKISLVQNVRSEEAQFFEEYTQSYHTQILDAIERGDYEAAYAAMEKDLRYFDR